MRIGPGHPLYKKLCAEAGIVAVPKPHKYGAKRTTVDGIAFPSQLEADTYSAIMLLKQADVLKDVRLQHTVEFMTYLGYQRKPTVERYKIDFSFYYRPLETRVWCEAKGVRTNRWVRCEKLWRLEGPGPLVIVTAEHYSRSMIRIPYMPQIFPKGKPDVIRQGREG